MGFPSVTVYVVAPAFFPRSRLWTGGPALGQRWCIRHRNEIHYVKVP